MFLHEMWVQSLWSNKAKPLLQYSPRQRDRDMEAEVEAEVEVERERGGENSTYTKLQYGHFAPPI